MKDHSLQELIEHFYSFLKYPKSWEEIKNYYHLEKVIYLGTNPINPKRYYFVSVWKDVDHKEQRGIIVFNYNIENLIIMDNSSLGELVLLNTFEKLTYMKGNVLLELTKLGLINNMSFSNQSDGKIISDNVKELFKGKMEKVKIKIQKYNDLFPKNDLGVN